MAYTRTLYGKKHSKYNYCEFVCDNTADLSSLPTNTKEGASGDNVYSPCSVGSKAFVINGGKRYVLSNAGEWIAVNVSSGEGGGTSDAGIVSDLLAIPVSDITLKDLLSAFPIEFPYSTGLCFLTVVGNNAPTSGTNTFMRAVFHIRNGAPYEMLYRIQNSQMANPESNPSLPLTWNNSSYFTVVGGKITSTSLTNNASYIAKGNRVNYTCVQIDPAG